VLNRVHTEIERQVQAVDEALQQLEDAFMLDPGTQPQDELSKIWVRAREKRDEGLSVLDKLSMTVCHDTDKTREGSNMSQISIQERVKTLAKLKTQHKKMQKMEAQMAAANPGKDWAPLAEQLHRLRQQRVQRPRIVCSHAVSSRTGQGLYALQQALAGLMEDTQLFAHVGAKVPLNYSMLERLAQEGREELHQPSTPVLYCGNIKKATLHANIRTISFTYDNFCTVRSRQECPVGSKAYYELEILEELNEKTCLQYGFASAAFTSQLGYTQEGAEDGVGDDAVSWAVDGARQVKLNKGEQEVYECQWKRGDVIGLACDLQAMQMLVSVNGSFAPPNGRVFELDPHAVLSGLFAAFSCAEGTVGYNLGEAPFKYNAPAADYSAFVDFELNPVCESVLFSTRTCLSSCCMFALTLCVLQVASDQVSIHIVYDCRRSGTLPSSMDLPQVTAPTGSRP